VYNILKCKPNYEWTSRLFRLLILYGSLEGRHIPEKANNLDHIELLYYAIYCFICLLVYLYPFLKYKESTILCILHLTSYSTVHDPLTGLISYLCACMSALWRGSHILGLIIKYKRGSHGIINMSFLSITGRKELIWICIRKMCVLYFNFWHNWRSRRTIIETIYNFFKFKKVKRWAVTMFCSIHSLWLRN